MKSNRISGLTYLKEEKSMKKRILSGLLALCMALVLMPTAVFAAKSDVSAGADTYYDVVVNASKREAYNSDSTRRGMLYDLNGDGCEELLLMYFTKTDVSIKDFPFLVFSVYTKQYNKVVPMWEEKEIYADAGGPQANIGVLRAGDKVYFCEYGEGGNATGPMPYEKVNYHGGYTLYSMVSNQLVKEGDTRFEYVFYNDNSGKQHIVSSSATLFGQPATLDQFKAWEKTVDKSLLMKPYTDVGMSFSQLLAELKENEPMQQPTLGNFYDVPVGAYYYDAVKWAVDNGITSGISETQFGPENTCTRAQAVTFIWKAEGSPEPKSSQNSFTDVGNDYYTKAVLWAVEQGIINGYEDNSFRPNGSCDRGMIVTMLWRAAGEPLVTGSSGFSDVADGTWYSDAVNWAAAKGISVGNGDGTFTPAALCTRGMIVTFLHRDMTAK